MDTRYQAAPDRYQHMAYPRVGRHGLKLPKISLGLWHNFGAEHQQADCRQLLCHAFDQGITHFDLANNYGPPPGSAEQMLGRILKQDLAAYRDELVISSKAGYIMWDGPYGDGGSSKYLFASLHQSLQRLGLDYVDIFYHHRPDPNTPLEETMNALTLMVRQGKALYVGLSNYPPPLARRAAQLLADLGTPCLINQLKYSMFERGIETATLAACADSGMGSIAFSPLAGGLLTDRYLQGIPADSRMASASPFLRPEQLTADRQAQLRALNDIAVAKGLKLSQLALLWVLRDPRVTSALIGASRTSQIDDAVQILHASPLSQAELTAIEQALQIQAGV